jgi:site-specific DNA-methyltransferase (adenine-specific)
MDGVTLLQGDCLELMKDLPDGCVDLTVTSPPYDNLRTYNGNISQWSFEKFQQVAKELYRVTADGGVVVWVVADATINGSETGTSFRQALYFKDIGFNLHDTMIWNKQALTFPHKNRYHNCFEYMFILSKGAPKSYNMIEDRKNKKAGVHVNGKSRQSDDTLKPMSGNGKRDIREIGRRFNVWDMSSCQSNKERTGHPAQFPEKLARDHVISWSNEGDTILDCFMGSGTTGVACVNTNRNFIGMEIDPQYFEIAKKRIKEAEDKQEVRDG